MQRSSRGCSVTQYGAAQPSGKIYAPGGPSLGLKEDVLFLEIGLFLYFWGNSEAAMGGGARSAPLGVAMHLKRRVRAAHGRARAAKTH